ncbi:MAG: phosphoglucosamine mutase [Acidimicrobiia bacterium]
MALSFGTDGVRGVANAELTPDYALRLGRAAATVLGGDRFVVGRDTRRSGPMLEAALAAGLASSGVDVELLGVIPTPGVARLAQLDGVPAAMISASHNPFADNGIKLFAAGGRKLPDDIESRIEAEMHESAVPTAIGAAVGDIRDRHGAVARYVDAMPAVDLSGLTVVLDTANGAASEVARELFSSKGASVSVIHAAPDGCNINDHCGATHPDDLCREVVARGADLGLAFDGDADRLIAVDHAGAVVDGDHLIALCAFDLHARGALTGETVVVTVMTNLGFRQAMAERGIKVVETGVGDRYVLEALDAGGFALGGEQSGHVIFRELATTGDGMLTGLQLVDLVKRSGRPLADLAREAMTRLPQVLVNVRLAERVSDPVQRLTADIADAELLLAGRGRVLVRPSGTEPLLRVMVEAPTAEQASQVASRLVSAAEREFGVHQ